MVYRKARGGCSIVVPHCGWRDQIGFEYILAVRDSAISCLYCCKKEVIFYTVSNWMRPCTSRCSNNPWDQRGADLYDSGPETGEFLVDVFLFVSYGYIKRSRGAKTPPVAVPNLQPEEDASRRRADGDGNYDGSFFVCHLEGLLASREIK